MLFCFDIDGTLETKSDAFSGPIPIKLLTYLQRIGHDIALVSPSPYGPKGFNVISPFDSNEYRDVNVLQAMEYYNASSDTTIYVDDLEANRIRVEKKNIKTLDPLNFLYIYAL